MSQTYLFYDIESTGLNKCFDQVLQFAAIRTDLDLNEIERHEILVKLNCDIIPSPGATITHQIGVQKSQEGIAEIDAIQTIHQLLNTPGTISLGYNTLTFDDEFLRFSFYRNLLSPYTHQYANQCSRMDLYPMTTFFYLYQPDALPQWPQNDHGQVSLKLERLNEVNQLAEGAAHDAMVDVEVTVALAKQLKKQVPMWQYLTGYFNKASDQARCQKLPLAIGNHQQGIMVLGRFGSRDQFQAPVLDLGSHHHYKNQTLWLRLDLPECRKASLDNIDEHTWVMHKKMAEPGFILPPSERYSQKMKPKRLEEMRQNLKFLNDHPHILSAICEYHQEYQYPQHPNVDVDAALYQSAFLSPNDTRQCQRFHQANPKQKAQLIEAFSRQDLSDMALRIVGRHYPEALSAEQNQAFQDYLAQVFTRDINNAVIDFRGDKRYTWAQCEEDMAELQKQTLTMTQQALLNELLMLNPNNA